VAHATSARRVALETLRAVRRGEFADRAFEAAAVHLEQRERAFAQELVYGAVRLRGRLEHRLACFSSRPLDRIDPDILDVLRLGAYQLTELDGVPPYAAIAESVELARDAGARNATGFVNAVLQALRRRAGECAFPVFESDPVAHLSTWGSHPRWLVERWIAQFGAAAARRLVEIDNERPHVYLRLLGDVSATKRQLAVAGIRTMPERIDCRACTIDGGDTARALHAAPVIVQDPAAGLVVTYASVPAQSQVLDLAAAPGGKALALTAVANDAAARFVVAADASLRRTQRMRDNVARLARPEPEGLGTLPVALIVADGRRPPFRPSDVVLCDAPCTGTGTLRRHPDGRWRLRPEDVSTLAGLQAELLDAAAGLVAPSGLLVYATCSLEPEENELQVTAFLARHRQFTIEPGHVADRAMLHVDGTLRVLPHAHGYDGAFAARLRRSP
jgi:16S rRNA (cytosine967-C5)-methyltransferase